jgi:hypothetical protein
MAYFDNMQVAPLDNTFDALAVVEYEDHGGLGLHLLLKVEELSLVAVLMIGDAGVLVGEQGGGLAAGLFAGPGGWFGEAGTHQLARPGG